MHENLDNEIVGELNISISHESQAEAERRFAAILGQLAMYNRIEAIREVSKGGEQDVEAQQNPINHTDYTVYDAIHFTAGAIGRHVYGGLRQNYLSQRRHVHPTLSLAGVEYRVGSKR